MLVTGGSQGMGKALACILAKRGANIIIVARTQRVLEEALKEISVLAASRPLNQILKLTVAFLGLRCESFNAEISLYQR